MNWKDWPYWLKGAIIFGFVSLLLQIVTIFSSFTLGIPLIGSLSVSIFETINTILFMHQVKFLVLSNIFASTLFPWIFPGGGNDWIDFSDPRMIALVSIIYAIAGALCGFIYGKIKGKNKGGSQYYKKKLINKHKSSKILNLEIRKKTRNSLIASTILFLLFIPVTIILAAAAAYTRSTNGLSTTEVIIYYSASPFPLIATVSLLASWVLYNKSRYKIALKVSLIPFINIIPILMSIIFGLFVEFDLFVYENVPILSIVLISIIILIFSLFLIIKLLNIIKS